MRHRILFADSSSTIQKVVEMAFENEEISVTMAGTGEEALLILEEIAPDLIVADEELQGISGIDLCKKIKESGLYSLIPFLMLRRGEEIAEDDSDHSPAPDDFLLKPFKSEELVTKVKELINISQSYNDEAIDLPDNQKETLYPVSDDEAANLLGSPDSQAQLNELIESATEDDILAGLDEEEESSLNEAEEFISLTGEEELSPDEEEMKGQPPELEVSSTEEDIPEEEMNLSGLLSEEEIQAGLKDIEKRNRELDEIFGFDYELNEDVSLKSDTDNAVGAETFFKEKRALSEPAPYFPAADLEAAIKSSLKKSLEDINEKVIREELKEYLNTLTPTLMKTIEKAIWDIMPELAESLLKKEIEKIKNG